MNARMLLKISPLALVLGAVPGWAQQQVLVGGATGSFDVITSPALDTLVADTTVVIPDTGSVWHCVATCSAEVAISVSDTDIDGRLALTFDLVEMPGADRKFELNANPGVNDSSPIEVSTTGSKLNFDAGTHRIACAAAKVSAEDADFNVNDSSLTYVCSDFAS